MAEGDINKTVLYDIQIKTEEAIKELQAIRAETENLKNQFYEIQAASGESFQAVINHVKKVTFDHLKDEADELSKKIRNVQAEIAKIQKENLSNIQSSDALAQAGVRIAPEDVARVDTGEITALEAKQQELNALIQQSEALQRDYEIAVQASRMATSELAAETKQIAAPIKTTQEEITQLRTDTAEAREQMIEMVQAGNSLDESIYGVSESAQLLPRATRDAGKELKGTFSDVRSQLEGLGESFDQVGEGFSDQFIANVVSAKDSMSGLVAEGMTLNQALATVQKQGLYTGQQLDASFKLLQQDMMAASAVDPVVAARQGLQALKTQVDAAKIAMQQLKAEGYSTSQILQGLKLAGFDTKAIQEAAKEMGILGDATAKTSNILSRIFAAGVIGFVLGALRNLTQAFREATEAGYELSRSFLDIAVQARALQREGGNVLPSEWISQAKELSKAFTQFSQQDINSAVSQLIRLGRQSDLTTEQIQRLITDALALATVKGMDAADAANAFATAVESGYARGLKEVIGAIDETTLAQEAIRRGLAETEDAVDANVRATTLLKLAQEELVRVGGDISFIQDDLTGQYLEGKNTLATLRAELGERLLPIQIRWQELLINAVGILQRLYDFLLAVNIPLKAFTTSLREALTLDLKNLFSGNFESDVSFIELYRENVEKLREEFGLLEDSNAADTITDIGEAAKGAADGVEELSDELKDALIDIRELFIDLYQDISDEQQKFEEDSLDAADAYAFDLLQLNQKLQYDIEKVWRGYYDDLAEENDDYRDREIEEEKKYQEKLRKLRENFLLDLEDALRERDARQIIRLIRQYNLRKTQLERERKDAADERKRDFEDQKEDLARQRDIRLRELQIENKQRKALMAKEFEEEERLRGEEHKRRLAEEREQAKERLDELLRRLVDEGTVTEEQAQALAQIYDSYFGTNGEIGITLDEFIAKLEETAKQAAIQMGYIGDAVQSVGKSTYGAGPQIPDAIKMINPPEGAEIPDALKTLEGLDIEFDDGRITQEAQKVTQVLEDEFGEDGAVSKVYDDATAQASTFVNESIPETFSGAEQQVTESADGIARGFTNAFGPGSTVEGTYLYLLELISNVVSAIISSLQAISQAISNFSSGSRKTTTVPEESPFGAGRKKMARGGTMFANTPTTVTFGEAGPEIAQFTPLNKSNSFGNVGGGSQMPSKSDLLNVLITLSPDLEARIIDTTLNETAQVIFDVERTQR